MPMPSSNSGLRDNHTRGAVADFLKRGIRDGSRLSVVSAYFTIYAYDALKECLDRIDHLDFLFSEPSFVNRLDPGKTEQKSFIIDADGLELANKLQQKCAAKERADWIERKVDIKTINQSNLLHGKIYYVTTAGAAHVTRILTAKQKNPSADTSALEHEIDQYVYALYGLTPDEIRLVEESATSTGRHAEPTADPIPSA